MSENFNPLAEWIAVTSGLRKASKSIWWMPNSSISLDLFSRS